MLYDVSMAKHGEGVSKSVMFLNRGPSDSEICHSVAGMTSLKDGALLDGIMLMAANCVRLLQPVLQGKTLWFEEHDPSWLVMLDIEIGR